MAIPLEYEALVPAVSGGQLPTEHRIDFEEALYPLDWRDPARKPGASERREAHAELAGDAASTALRGGHLIYGVIENDDRLSFTPVGMALEVGLRKTVTRVIAALVTPPLEVVDTNPTRHRGLRRAATEMPPKSADAQ